MKHIKSLAIKFVASLAILYIILGVYYNLTFSTVFLITAVVGIVAYLIGDMIILPRTNNTIATMSDLGLAFMIIWLMTAGMTGVTNPVTMTFIAALGIALFEYFYHIYLVKNIIKTDGSDRLQSKDLRYQTEAAEELTPNSPNNKNKYD